MNFSKLWNEKSQNIYPSQHYITYIYIPNIQNRMETIPHVVQPMTNSVPLINLMGFNLLMHGMEGWVCNAG
jgi:hypothetical protein